MKFEMFFKMLVMLVSLFLLSACGLKGPLYMPTQQSKEQATTKSNVSNDTVSQKKVVSENSDKKETLE